ncbi:death domain-containing protein, partial [Endozoicomonas sp. ONNA1]|uniref:death domain-containing protein n=1 Tax=Endozoicomonas sp. ONNA1 TaxID=2828740 RepID=UPI0021480AC1
PGITIDLKIRLCLIYRESNLVEEGAAKESNPVIRRDSEIMVSKEDANYSAIRIFQWFQSLKFDGRKRGDYFHINDYYKFPELYNLLTQSFMSDKDTLSKFHSKWVGFLHGSISIYHLISEVGELAKSQGVENYAEVTRIVKALALKRDEFESKLSLERFGNELSNYLTRNNLLGSDESTQNLYSGLDSQKKLELINSIYKVFEQLGNLLQSEIFPSEYITIRMLNALARDIYYKYLFGIPAINDESLELENIMWGFSGHNQYSFITSYNSEILHQLHSYEPLQTLALSVSSDGSSNLEEVRAMFTVVVLVRSMLAQRLRAILPEHALFAKDVPHEQLKLLSNFSLNASERLVLMLDHTKPEEKDEFIRNMFLIFGMVPTHLSDELSGQWDPESVPLTQAAAHATGPLYQQPKRRTAKSVIMESVLSQWELLNIGYKLGDDWKNFAINTDVISYDVVRVIDANFVGVVDKTMQMLERWKQRKGRITFKDLMVILDKIKRDDLRREIMEYYGL